MKKVITYGTYDLLHHGHIQLLRRARELGDYLIVGVTSDNFDRKRGKINVRQSLMQRIEGVRQTGIADEIIIEEYEGQKIDDIKRLGADIFTVGSDWTGKFDYLNQYCQVIYLDRTQGISSSEIRSKENQIKIGLVGVMPYLAKFINESRYVNGVKIAGLYTRNSNKLDATLRKDIPVITQTYRQLLENVDAVYIVTPPQEHYWQIKEALENGKHVLCESPVTESVEQCNELFDLAEKKGLILFDAIKTAYSTAYSRLILLAKGGKIGNIVSVDTTCTSLSLVDYKDTEFLSDSWNSLSGWGPTAMLPVFQLLGTDYKNADVYTLIGNSRYQYDKFTKIAFLYPSAVASIKVGQGVKSEGELIISGTKGYIYVPAPWWKTDYFELRFENTNENKRYFYQLDGEGIRNEILCFIRSIEHQPYSAVSRNDSVAFCRIMQRFRLNQNIHHIRLKH